jgi:4,5-DOPA dioxygenase extradiol
VDAGGVCLAWLAHGRDRDGRYQEALERFGREHRPSAVIVISAHWESDDTVRINSAAKHHLVYDFGSFPRELYELTYEAAGEPELAQRINGLLREAEVPIVELSIPVMRRPADLFRIGELLSPLRSEKLEAWDIEGLLRYKQIAPSAALAVPTNEHFHPVFVVLGAARGQGRVERIHEGFQYGTLSMRSFAVD